MNKLPRFLAPIADFLARHSAIIALAVFAVAGVAVLDDYGAAHDEWHQKTIGAASLYYILGDETALLGKHKSNSLYGVAFEVPLTVAERVLRLEDSREIALSRHLITHLFFLAGGLFAWMLARRLFSSRLVALLAMLIFLLHPRIYAHSFFNTKDLPFLSMFAIALYLVHRAFRRDSVWAFALCGAGVALLANMRIIGVMLFPAVLGMLALDAVRVMKSRRGARRELVNAGAFCAAFAAILYATWPLLWREPLKMAETLEVMSQHPTHIATLFRGELVQWPNIPWDFIPTWILITTPPVALILAALGIAHLARLCAIRPRAALANSAARFGLLAVACLILPVVVAVALNSNLYDDWRQMYFLYAPICVLAAFGLRALADIPKTAVRAGAFALTALGIAAAAVQMVNIHPYQNDYFNSLVDKSGLGERWEMDFWGVSHREALEAALRIQPSGGVAIADMDDSLALHENIGIIPPDDRRRLHVNPRFPSYRVILHPNVEDAAVWTREIYGVPVISLADARAESQAAHGAIYAAARASEPDASAGGFDLYADGGELAYIKDDCGEDDARELFGLTVFSAVPNDPRNKARPARLRYETLDFRFHERGAIFGGKCVIVQDLPDYPISHIETARRTPEGEGARELWSAGILFAGYYERYRRALAALSGESPAIRSDFAVYLKDGALIYVKDDCAESDTRGRFFLSVFPADPSDLSQTARDAGYEHEPLNFDFAKYGAIFDGKCVIIRELPDYPIKRIETGQWIPGDRELWSGMIAVGD